LKIKRIDHVAINVKDQGKAIKFFTDLLGEEFDEPSALPELGVVTARNSLGIELIEPASVDSALTKEIEQRGEGVGHISLEVANLKEAMSEMESKGIRLIWSGSYPEFKVALYHPKDLYGVQLGLIERSLQNP
jgi:methylmalonyl-CoA epimerase